MTPSNAMPKFHVGQVVRVVSIIDDSDVVLNEIGTILKQPKHIDKFYLCRFQHIPKWFVHEDALAPVTIVP